ncbi:hypothetical protein [Yersinia kristensenii]|nr:hypothetical protein [Yersinia kristensenii]CNL68376.1 Uncharacterised protein [Yersinia kristensenii]
MKIIKAWAWLIKQSARKHSLTGAIVSYFIADFLIADFFISC